MANRLHTMDPAMVSIPSVSQPAKGANVAARAPNNGNVIKRYVHYEALLVLSYAMDRQASRLTVTPSLQSELFTLMSSPTPGLSAFPTSDMTKWNATITGPTDTPYDSLTFKLSLSYPSNYPYAPPEVLFKTPIYHPNVDMSGRICLDILKPGGQGKEGAWSAVLNTGSVLLSIQSLLGEPNK